MPCRCRVIHKIKGRVRLRVRGLPGYDGVAERVAAYLRTQAGVQAVRLNHACHSITLIYNPEILEVEKLVKGINDLGWHQLQAYRWAEFPPLPSPGPPKWWLLGFSTVALSLSFITHSALVSWLLLGAGLPLYKLAFESLFVRTKLNPDTLDATALTILTIRGQTQPAAVLLWLIYSGEYIRHRTARQMQKLVASRFDSRSHSVLLIQGLRDQIRSPAGQISPGDELAVYPGEVIPVDGVISQGQATVDQQSLTGELMPVAKGPGDRVYAGTVVQEGEFRLQAEKIGTATVAGQVMQLFEKPDLSDTPRYRKLKHRTETLIPGCFLGAGAAYSLTHLFKAATALLIIDYCTGVRISAPTTTMAAISQAAQQGVLIKEGGHLEMLAEIDTLVFAGRGSLSTGIPEVLEVISYQPEVSSDQVLALAAGAESNLTHPVATALVQSATCRGLQIPSSDGPITTTGGLGVETMVGGTKVQVGCQRFMKAKRVALAKAKSDILNITELGCFPALVAQDGKLLGLVIYQDRLRPEAAAVIPSLRQLGVKEFALVSGERPNLVQAVAQQVGISHYLADAGPRQKADFYRALQRPGHQIAVVTDGRGAYQALDHPAIGFAVGGGTKNLLEKTPLVVIGKNLWGIPRAIDLSRDFRKRSQQHWDINFYASTVALALALTGFIGPMEAILLNNGTAVLMALNGLRPLREARRSDQGHNQGLQRRFHSGPGH
ncbi:MAG: heavy metal translocating P-type ATPase [Desulfobacteraceae bacterium]